MPVSATITEHLSLRHPDDSAVAIQHTSERLGAAGVAAITFGELRLRVRQMAAALRRCGRGQHIYIVGHYK